jgi:hypothetical protein
LAAAVENRGVALDVERDARLQGDRDLIGGGLGIGAAADRDRVRRAAGGDRIGIGGRDRVP